MNSKIIKRTRLLAIPTVIFLLFFIIKFSHQSHNKPEVSEHERFIEDSRSELAAGLEKNSPAKKNATVADCNALLNRAYRRGQEWRKHHLFEYVSNSTESFDPELLAKALSLVESENFALKFYHKYRKSQDTKKPRSSQPNNYDILEKKYGKEFVVESRLHWPAILRWDDTTLAEFMSDYSLSLISTLSLIRKTANETDIKRVLMLSDHLLTAHRPSTQSERPYPSSVFESLVRYKKVSLVDWYIKQGGMNRDAFGANALELLVFYHRLPELESSRGLVSLLIEHGFNVRYSVMDSGFLAIGDVIQFTTDIAVDDIRDYESMGISFVQVMDQKAREQESREPGSQTAELAARIQLEKDAFMDATDDLSTSQLEYCKSRAQFAGRTLSNPEYFDDYRKLYDSHSGDIDELKEAFYPLEPGLVDCITPRSDKPTKTEAQIERKVMLDALVSSLESQDAYKTLNELNNLSLTGAERSRLFWRVVKRHSELVEALLETGFLPNDHLFAGVSSVPASIFVRLVEAGINFDRPNNFGRSLVEIAASQCHVPLIKELHNQGYRYQFDPRLSDALGIALRTRSCSHPQLRADMVQALLAFDPEVKPYHWQRLAELKIRHVESYNALVGFFPESEINESLKPTGHYCSTIVLDNDPYWAIVSF